MRAAVSRRLTGFANRQDSRLGRTERSAVRPKGEPQDVASQSLSPRNSVKAQSESLQDCIICVYSDTQRGRAE